MTKENLVDNLQVNMIDDDFDKLDKFDDFSELEDRDDMSLDDFDLDELEMKLQNQLQEELSELNFLETERAKIENPDALTHVIQDEVWSQFANQIGLDATDETLIDKYDKQHTETYDEVGNKVLADKKYKDANKDMKEKKEAGKLKDEYTGKDMSRGDSANLDHVVSRKEIYENQRRKQANLSTEDLANKSENLQATNESLNKSKSSKSVDEYLKKRPEREEDLKKQNARANKKIDESNMSDTEKKLAKEKNNKRMQDKLDADDELMKKADKKARKAINKDIRRGATKEIGKKAGKDALKTMAISSLFSLLKEIMNGLVRFFKSKAKSFKSFLAEMKKAISSFFSKISSIFQTGASTMIGTIVSEIFGPIVQMFKKLTSLIKQGAASLVEAVKYLTDKENKDKPFSVKVAQVGKIITASLVGGSALILGEIIEKVLMTVPGMQITLPLVGTLANIIGMFLASVISGVIGAIIINKIDKLIAKQQKSKLISDQVDKGNDILVLQEEILELNEDMLAVKKEKTAKSITNRHKVAAEKMKKSMDNIFSEEESYKSEDIDEMDVLLEKLFD